LIDKIGADGAAKTIASEDKQLYEPVQNIEISKLLQGYAPLEALEQQNPVILAVEESSLPAPHVRVSFRFGEGEEVQHNAYFPPVENWTKRFIQSAHPFLGVDVESPKLEFYLSEGAYTVTVPIGVMGYQSYASSAHVARTIARNLYSYSGRIYGYLYGGSGGSMQAIGALESETVNMWDGIVPFIVASSASLGNFDIRLFARMVLESKGSQISDALKPGGSGDPYATLNELETEIFDEVTMLGLSLKAWENYEYLFLMHDYPTLEESLNASGVINEAYTYSFWNEPGYLEAYHPDHKDLFYELRERGVSERALAKIAYHRHKDPGPKFHTWDHLRDSNGSPIYAQTQGDHYSMQMTEITSGGGKWTGNIHCKAIACVMQKDADAYPSDGNYYRERVKEMGLEDNFRLWFNESADHHEIHEGYRAYLNDRLISFTGILEQALMDLGNWVENGIEPPKSTEYEVVRNQLVIADAGRERGGIQPMVSLTVDGASVSRIALGETVHLTALMQAPLGAGEIISVEWDFLGNGNFAQGTFESQPDGSWISEAAYSYPESGTYFPRVRVALNREGDQSKKFRKVCNMASARVIAG
jgi:hypothetical protein